MFKTLASFILVLLLMPLGHALMILMEHFLSPGTLHCAAFAMGFAGLLITLAGTFQRGDTRQTLWGITGAMLFWTGWVEFLFAYFAQRFGTHCDLLGSGTVETLSVYRDGLLTRSEFLINGQPLESFSRAELKMLRGSRPEYLIMPATFGLWTMVMTLYLFTTRTGCNFMRWVQRHTGLEERVELRPMAHHANIVVFMEWNVMMWGDYLLLMFLYDPAFVGPSHPLTLAVAAAALAGSFFMLRKQLSVTAWGRNIRFSLATVIVFWTFVEIMGRNGFLKEIWVDPLHHAAEMSAFLAVFVGLGLFLLLRRR